MTRGDIVRVAIGACLIGATALVIHLRVPIPAWAMLSWLGILAAAFILTYVVTLADEAARREEAETR